ncbi:e3 ubiquitin-protein ligase chip [Anaeramoeba ignava]|uniref:E3 ubiquitin-protein ligase chip n=1 Tax=Anaeramoeba ignava TaxID=1746090 RepID=A0A9Q0LPJ4_ANAIG|nr:e3 ubiquitin-protein ligase chip [Anaeramoeba ignava]
MSISNYLLSELNVKIPVTLIDPTTNHIFLEPITLQTGETFDRSTLQKTQWINPETNELIDQSTTFLNLKIQQQVTQFLINEANQFFKNLIKKNVNEQIDSIISFVSFLPHETNITIKQESQTLMGNFLEKQMNGIGSKTFNDSLSNLNDKKKYKLILYLLHSDLPKIVISLFENAPEFLKVFPVDNPQLMTKLKLVNDFNPDLIDRFIQVLVSQKSYYQVEQYFDYGIPIEKADEYYEGMIDQFNENRDITPSFCEHFVNVIYNHLFLSTRDEDELLLCANILLKKCVPIILNQKNLIQTEEQKIRAILHKIALIFACFPTISKITSDIFSKELLFVSCFSQVNVDTKIAHSGRKLISILLQRFYYVDDGRIHFGNVENKISRMISYSVQLPFILLAQINQQFTENDVSKHLSVLSEAMKSRLLWETKLSIIEKFVDEYSNRKNIKIPLAEELLSELFRAIRMFPLNTLPSVLSTIEIISRGSDNKPKIADQKGIQIILEAMKMNQQKSTNSIICNSYIMGNITIFNRKQTNNCKFKWDFINFKHNGKFQKKFISSNLFMCSFMGS